jgi:hypothetical protein
MMNTKHAIAALCGILVLTRAALAHEGHAHGPSETEVVQTGRWSSPMKR